MRSRSAPTDRRCWPASTSVGAMIAAWCPDWIAIRHAWSATSVLPAPDVALEQQVHRLRRLHAPVDLRHRADLRVGRDERQRGSERLRQRAFGGVGHTGALGLQSLSAERHPELEREQLVELQPLARHVELVLIGREVDPPKSLVAVGQRLGRPDVLGQRIGLAGQLLQREPHQLTDRPSRDAVGRRMHGGDPAGVHEVLLAAAKHLDLLVGELEPPAIQLDDARHGELCSLLVPGGDPGLVEERQVQEAGSVPDGDGDHGLAAPGLALGHRTHRGDHGGVRVDRQLRDGQHAGPVDVATGIVMEELPDGLDAERIRQHLMCLGTLRPTRSALGHAGIDRDDRILRAQRHGRSLTVWGSTMPA